MACVDFNAALRKVEEIATGADGDAHDIVDLHTARSRVGAVQEERGKVQIQVARPLWHLARSFNANDNEEPVAREGGCGHERAKTCGPVKEEGPDGRQANIRKTSSPVPCLSTCHEEDKGKKLQNGIRYNSCHT